MTKQVCKNCRWQGKTSSWDDYGTCSIIHSGGGDRADNVLARLFPVTSGAYLQVNDDFGCNLWEDIKKE